MSQGGNVITLYTRTRYFSPLFRGVAEARARRAEKAGTIERFIITAGAQGMNVHRIVAKPETIEEERRFHEETGRYDRVIIVEEV